MAAAAAGILALGASTSAHASVESAAKAYAAGRFDAAAKEFDEQSARKPKDARLAFNAGDAAYRAGQYDAADAAFKRALAAADPKLQQQVLYNDGDVLYRSGEALKPEEREQTIAKWKAAIDAYDGAIALDSKDADARYNRDFVKRKLDALEQKQKQDEKKDDKKDDKKDSSGSKDDKKDSSGSKDDKKDSSGSNDDKKDSPGSKGEKKDSKSGGGGQDDDKGSKGDKDGKNGGTSDKNPTSGGKDAKPSGQPSTAGSGTPTGTTPGQAPAGQRPGTDGKDGAQPGRLSARDARSLLGALRGDERRGISHGTAEGQPSDDSPRKDW
jgi:hypothetical protein